MNDDEHVTRERSTLRRHRLRRNQSKSSLNQERRKLKYDRQDKDDNAKTKDGQEADNCANCICDLAHAIMDLKRILIQRKDLLSEITVYDCSKYNDIGEEIVISSSNLEFLPRHYAEFETKGRKYVEQEEIESSLRHGVRGQSDHEILTLPGFNLNIPCNHEGEDFMWTMSISRPNYNWSRTDNLPFTGYIQKNGALELYDVDARSTGNYSCFISYIDPDNEEPVLSVYSHRVQVVTLPDYILRGGNRYEVDVCDDAEVDDVATFLPQKLNDVLCQNEICEAYIFTPHCRRQKIFVNTVLIPANIAKLVPSGIKVCGIRCRKAIQDKIALLLSRNLRSVLQKPIVFRLPHHQERLVPTWKDNKRRLRNERGRSKKHKSSESAGEVGLLIGCPAGYSLQDTHCLPCGVGFYSEDGSSHCKKCPKGTHQPNAGSRTCHACINPFVEGCHDMIWNSSSVILIAVITICVSIVISMIAILFVICMKRKCRKKDCKTDEIPMEQTYNAEDIPLLHDKETTDDGENVSDNDDKEKMQREVKKKFRKYNENCKTERNFVIVDKNELLHNQNSEKKKQKRKIVGFQYVPIACLESYRSHKRCSENYLSKIPNCKKPPVPVPDFEKEIHHL